MEYDGSSYDYDKNGRLVTIGNGNGQAAEIYNPLNFFRNGIRTSQELSTSYKFKSYEEVISFSYERDKRSGIIPNSNYLSNTWSAKFRGFGVSNFLINSNWAYQKAKSDLPYLGGNIAHIIGSTYSSPISFDNSNGLSRSEASINSNSYLTQDGTNREAASAINNPFGLINESHDADQNKSLIGDLNIKYVHLNNGDYILNYQWNGTIENLNSNQTYGDLPQFNESGEGILTDRTFKQRNYVSHTRVIFGTYKTNVISEAHLAHFYKHQQSEVKRVDDLLPMGSQNLIDINEARNIHEYQVGAKFIYQKFASLYIVNHAYFSNTLKKNNDLNFYPVAELKFKFHNLFDYFYPLRKFEFLINAGKSINETPLVYNNWAHISTTLSMADYHQHYNTGELTFINDLLPEISDYQEVALFFDIWRIDFNTKLNRNRTSNYISPVLQNDAFILNNVGTIEQTNFEWYLSYHDHLFYEFRWGISALWQKNVNRVINITGNQDVIPISGFQEVSAVLAEGEPVGVIYGNGYLRDDSGRVIIDDNGYPVKNSSPSIVGNPLPKWTGAFSFYLTFRRLRFDMIWDVKYGGDRWNGTQSYLDYLGRSQVSADQRNTTGFVFDGVNQTGEINTTTVDFYDPSQSIVQNRWVRYGPEGIAEDYIQETSWVRLKDIGISYDRDFNGFWCKLSFKVKNLILITPYEGVDPGGTLYNQNQGYGLDLFNTPATRQFITQLTINI